MHNIHLVRSNQETDMKARIAVTDHKIKKAIHSQLRSEWRKEVKKETL